MAVDAAALGAIVVADGLRPSASEAVARLRRLGLRTVLLTGDHASAARRVADAVGVDETVAGVMPTEKAAVIARLQAEGRRVAMVGDGIVLARRTLRTIRGNLVWAFAYNVAAIPLAAAGLLNPLVAGFAMSLSSVFVVSNSARLRTFDPSR